MKTIVLYFLLFFCMPSILFGQFEFKEPSSTTKLNYACREVIFTDLEINNHRGTVARVKKGEKIRIKLKLETIEKCDYCPSCIVQIYWGIYNYTSTCTLNFYGYESSLTESELDFEAPNKDGIYYVTMGGSLQYNCENNLQRPVCDPHFAIAVLVVGKPDPEKKIALELREKNKEHYLESSIIKSGCFGNFDIVSWYFQNQLLANETQAALLVKDSGMYRVVWKNCVGDSAYEDLYVGLETYNPVVLKKNDEKVDTTDLSYQVKNSHKFILNNLEFATSSYFITDKSKLELNKLVKAMMENTKITILLEGHTDHIGSPEPNQKLSEDRVLSTKTYLVSQGIQENRISIKGWGDTRPLTQSYDEAERKKNRRVEITILTR